jgi:Na+/proline symporter
MTNGEHRALDERLDIIGWGVALIVLAIILYLPGVHSLWHYLIPFGLVFIGMSFLRKQLNTRKDNAGLILGLATAFIGLLDMVGLDLRFFPLVPTVLVLIGILLIVSALISRRVRTDPSRPPEGA